MAVGVEYNFLLHSMAWLPLSLSIQNGVCDMRHDTMHACMCVGGGGDGGENEGRLSGRCLFQTLT